MAEHVAGDGTIWVQPDGLNTKPELLGCHMLDDVARPRGDLNLRYCPDHSRPSAWKIALSYRGEPGPVTTTITTYIEEIMDFLELVSEADCPVPLYILKRHCGRSDTFTNYERAYLCPDTIITNEGLTQLVAREPTDENASEQSFDIASPEMGRALAIKTTRQDIGETTDLLDIGFCNAPRCAGLCGDAQAICTEGVVVGAFPAGSPTVDADVWYTINKGEDWNFDGNPFAAGEDIVSFTCFQVGRDTTRWLVARGTADLANPMEIAYSDDQGATWTNVDVGTVNGQYATRGTSLFSLDMYHIWLVTTGGYVYFSDDGGVTWTAQEEGDLTTQNLNAVHFINARDGTVVGDSDEILLTNDGGTHWGDAAAVTGSGDNLLSCRMISADRIWIGADEAAGDATLYFTHDGGATWTARYFASTTNEATTGEVVDIQFVDEYGMVGWLLHNTTDPYGQLFRTINGGHDWEGWGMPTPDNVGLNALWACGINLAYAVGNAVSGLSYIVKAYAESK